MRLLVDVTANDVLFLGVLAGVEELVDQVSYAFKAWNDGFRSVFSHLECLRDRDKLHKR